MRTRSADLQKPYGRAIQHRQNGREVKLEGRNKCTGHAKG
jgi:hypothetical protein